MTLGFGLDLAGYSTGKSEVAVAHLENGVLRVILLNKSPFSRIIKSSHDSEQVGILEAVEIDRMLTLGKLAVDVPIDLQGLPGIPASTFVWGQTKRPIDFALGALAPFADRLGSVVSRFQNALRFTTASELLGKKLFETYPAASLVSLRSLARGYKGPLQHDKRTKIANFLGLSLSVLSDDELDAIICALAAVAPDEAVLESDGLELYIAKEIGRPDIKAPNGYRILKMLFADKIEVARSSYVEWMEEAMA